ncbi:GAF domain-containing protein [Nocardioides lijunqiniae]|uniref:GAF domain-containing protein n=1 Tax=Nocardioides lijunqiniae TaxID=2760832 RepID=UPI001877E8BD
MPERQRDAHHELGSPRRLEDLEASGLLDFSAVVALDALTQVVRASLGPDTDTMVNVVTADHQVTVSRAPGRDQGQAVPPISLSSSMCKHVVLSGQPYLVPDTANDPRHRSAAREFGIGAYAGFPVRGSLGTVIGAVCTVAPRPRLWSDLDLTVIGSVATAVESLVTLHTDVRRAQRARISGAVPAEASARAHHSIRTPMTSLLGFLDLLLDGNLGELSQVQQDAVQRCHSNAERVRGTVEALI